MAIMGLGGLLWLAGFVVCFVLALQSKRMPTWGIVLGVTTFWCGCGTLAFLGMAWNAMQKGVFADVVAPRMLPLAVALDHADLRTVLVLDGITTPANVGMILRSATAAGVDGVVVPRRGVASIDPLVVKAYLGGAAASQTEGLPAVLQDGSERVRTRDPAASNASSSTMTTGRPSARPAANMPSSWRFSDAVASADTAAVLVDEHDAAVFQRLANLPLLAGARSAKPRLEMPDHFDLDARSFCQLPVR